MPVIGVILFSETLGQKADEGTPLPKAARRQGIVSGVKVEKGTAPPARATGDLITQGLDGLVARVKGYKPQGALREVARSLPHRTAQSALLGIEANAETRARYAATCRKRGIVPVVGPDVLLDGEHSMQSCTEVSEAALHAVFHALHRHGVLLQPMLLKPSMVLPGKEPHRKAASEEVAHETVKVFRGTVPAAAPSIDVLLGGQMPEEATATLNAMNTPFPVRRERYRSLTHTRCSSRRSRRSAASARTSKRCSKPFCCSRG